MKKTMVALLFCVPGLWAQSVETVPFRAVLSSANEVPAIEGLAASGTATVLAHIVRDANGNIVSGSVDFNARYQFPGAVELVGMHIHRAPAGTNGAVVIDSGLGAAPVTDATGSGKLAFQGQVSNEAGLAALKDMLADPSAFYLNIHTSDNKGGAIRGQLQRATMAVLLGEMSPQNETPPPPGVSASGLGAVIVLATRNTQGAFTSAEVIFDVNYSGFPEGTVFTGLHVHNGVAGVAGPVAISSGIGSGSNSVPVASGGAGNLHFSVEADVTKAGIITALTNLFGNPAATYINLHTTSNPGGVIRGPLHATEHRSFQVTMSPANEVPPITGLDAGANAAFDVFTLRNSVVDAVAGVAIFDVNFKFPADSKFVGLHVHEGTAGVNGGVSISSGLSGSSQVVAPAGGAGNIFRITTISSGTGLRVLNTLLLAPQNVYMNVHTTVNAGGAARGQLSSAVPASPQITGVASLVGDPVRTSAAPGGLIAISGSGLTRVTGDLSGFTGQTIPQSMNGTRVTIGLFAAPVLSVSSTTIVSQVPLEIAPGAVSVSVQTASGFAGRSLTVKAASPDLFFTTTGGIVVRNSDFSLVTADNPAAAGDILIAFGTNFGQTNPPMFTGHPVPVWLLNFTSPAKVSIGGSSALVYYSIASPGFVGLNQVAFQVPTGVSSGAQPLAVSIGSETSNSVLVHLR